MARHLMTTRFSRTLHACTVRRLRQTLGATLAVATALCTALLTGTPAAFAGDRQVHPGAACQQMGNEDASAKTWRGTHAYLANNSGSTKIFICPAVNDTLTTGVSDADAYVFSNAQCYVMAVAWGTWDGGAFSPTKTGTVNTLSALDFSGVTTPGSTTFGSYSVVCTLPNNAAILQYFIDQK